MSARRPLVHFSSRTSAAWFLAVMVGLAGLAPAARATGTTAPTAPTAPYNVIAVVGDGPLSDSGNMIDEGQPVSLSGTTDALTLTADSVDSVSLTAATGSTLAVGISEIHASADASHVGLDVTLGGRHCPGTSGSIDIDEISTDQATGAVTRFAATVTDLSCSGTPSESMTLRANSTLDYAIALVNDNTIPVGSGYEGSTNAATGVLVRNEGPRPLTFTSAPTMTGRDASSYLIVDDGCAGVTLAYEESCSVDVATHPVVVGTILATLTVPTDANPAITDLNASSAYSALGTFYSIASARLLDTRIGLGAPKQRIAGGTSIFANFNGRAGIPATGVAAVAVNLTVVNATTSGYVTAYRDGVARPNASTINYVAGITRSNFTIVPVDSRGYLDLYNSWGHVDVVADVTGWYAATGDGWSGHPAGAALVPNPPIRLLDTRTTTVAGVPARARVPVRASLDSTEEPTTSAIAVNVTVVKPSSGGYVTAFNGHSDPTMSSTVNLRKGETRPNFAVVPTSCDGANCHPVIWIYNGSDHPIEVIVDQVGVYAGPDIAGGLRFEALAPTRIVDTRIPLGASPLGSGVRASITVPGSVVDSSTQMVMANVTAIRPTLPTYLTLWGSGGRPGTSNLNVQDGATVANAAEIPLDSSHRFSLYNHAGHVNVAIDIDGLFESYP